MRIAVILTFLFSSLMAFAGEKVTELFTLDHQMSEHCEKKIKENLRFEKGVSKIEVSLKDNTISITYDAAKTDTAKIIEGFKKIGFNAMVYNPEMKSAATCCQSETQGCCSQKTESCCGENK